MVKLQAMLKSIGWQMNADDRMLTGASQKRPVFDTKQSCLCGAVFAIVVVGFNSLAPGQTLEDFVNSGYANSNDYARSYPQSHTWSNLNYIAYGNGLFVVIGDGGISVTSPDGWNWTVHNHGTGGALAGISSGLAYGGGRFVAVGNSGTDGMVQLSPDGVSWSQPVTIPSVTLNAIAYGSSEYVACGQSNGSSLLTTSPDGINWSGQTLQGYGALNAIAEGGGRFVAVGDSGTVVTSSDGGTWSAQSIGITNYQSTNLVWVVYGQGMYVAQAREAPFPMISSMDGLKWNMLGKADLYDKVAYGGGRFVGFDGPNFISTSRTGTNWTYIWYHLGAFLPGKLDIAYGNGLFVTVGQLGVIWDINLNYHLTGSSDGSGNFGLKIVGGGPPGEVGRVQGATAMPATKWADLFVFSNHVNGNTWNASTSNYPQRFFRVVSP
jgi:hypothetical protein